MNARTLEAALVAGAIAFSAAPALSEPESGIALRQNALTVGWPGRSADSPFPAGTLGMSETRLRAWLGQTWGETTVRGALEAQTGFGSGAGFALLGAPPDQGRPFEVWDLGWAQATPSSALARARIERLDVAWRWGALDLDLGRQPVSLGTSHFVGVLDVLAPFGPGALDATYKPGIDALRARTALGDSGEAEVILAGRDPWHAGGALARLRTSWAGTDVELVGGHFRERGFGGLGWEGQLGPAGIWGEVALFQRRLDVEQLRGGWSQAAFSGVVGADVELPFDARGGAALLYQDFGARRPEDLPSVYLDAPYRESWTFLGSAGYGVVTLSRQLHPLVSSSVAGLVNLVDGSSLWQPRVTVSIGDNADLGSYAWIGLGAGPRTVGGAVTPGSEFGQVPSGLGLYARWFF